NVVSFIVLYCLLKDYIYALKDSLQNTDLVIFKLATARIFEFSFSALNIGEQMIEPFMQYADNTIAVMLLESIILFIGGFIFDGTVMVVVLVPLFLPLVQATAIDPLQFAIVVIIVWGIGQQTP